MINPQGAWASSPRHALKRYTDSKRRLVADLRVWGIIPNVKGRVVTDPESERRVVGEYVTGWIKRGPSGVIGTNKADSVETVECMLEDLAMGLYLGPTKPEADAVEEMFVNCKPTRFSWEDWQRAKATLPITPWSINRLAS